MGVNLYGYTGNNNWRELPKALGYGNDTVLYRLQRYAARPAWHADEHYLRYNNAPIYIFFLCQYPFWYFWIELYPTICHGQHGFNREVDVVRAFLSSNLNHGSWYHSLSCTFHNDLTTLILLRKPLEKKLSFRWNYSFQDIPFFFYHQRHIRPRKRMSNYAVDESVICKQCSIFQWHYLDYIQTTAVSSTTRVFADKIEIVAFPNIYCKFSKIPDNYIS